MDMIINIIIALIAIPAIGFFFYMASGEWLKWFEKTPKLSEKDRKRFLKKMKSAIDSGEMTATPNGASVVYKRCVDEMIDDKIAKLPFDINKVRQELKKAEADALEEAIDETLASEPFQTIIKRLDSVAEKKAAEKRSIPTKE